MAIRTDQFTNSLTVVDTVNANASLSLIPQGTGSVGIPGTGQNLVTQSQTFTGWAANAVSTTINSGIAPDGTNTAVKMVEAATTNYHYVSITITVASGTTSTLSCYCKAAERTFANIQLGGIGFSNFGISVNLTNGTFITYGPLTSSSVVDVGNGWYRCSISGVSTNPSGAPLVMMSDSSTSVPQYAGNGTSGIFIWGCQVETGPVANTYIPTTSSPIYGTPSLSFSGVSGLGLQSDGSLYASSAGAGNIRFYTNNVGQEQARISHTANAVNYVNLTGGATGVAPTITAAGSDANIVLRLGGKGSGTVDFASNGNPYAFQVIGIASGANYNSWRATSGAGGSGASSTPVLSTWGIDTNVALALQSKGTGGIDLAAGSSGVNISNGTTVTGITSTDPGSAYTSVPTVNITAPTTAGGVQAVITTNVAINAGTIGSGGTGYTVGNVLTLVGGTTTGGASTWTVAAVSGGVVTSVTSTSPARYTAFPALPASVTGGSGSGFTFSALTGFVNQFVISNAGSGYVEQPTVTFSGGGGSSAAAYATVGSNTSVKSIGTSLLFYTPAGVQGQFSDSGGSTPTAYPNLNGSSFGLAYLTATGSAANAGLVLASKGASAVGIYTNSTGSQAASFSHTASAVNYVQATGAVTGSGPTISAQGSDTNVNLFVNPKGTGALVVNPSGGYQFTVVNTSSSVNWLEAKGGATGSGPQISAVGTDTNIDLNVTAKGTGGARFNVGNGVKYTYLSSDAANNTQLIGAVGGNLGIYATSAGSIRFYTTTGLAEEQLRITQTVSAVNYVNITGSATGGSPIISTQGSDTNAPLILRSKGTFACEFQASTGAVSLQALPTASSVNYYRVSPATTGFGPVLSAQGSDTNIPAVVQPKGTGALQAQQTDSTATGGNVRGQNGVDWQMARGAAGQVASGVYPVISGGFGNANSGFASVIGGGYDNGVSSNFSSVLGGRNNTASGTQAVAVGGYLNTSAGYLNFIGGGFTNSATSGSAVTTQSGTMNATTAVTLSSSNANIKVGQYITGTSISGDTYVAAISGTSLTLSKVASGSSTSTLSFYTPHGVVVGGGNNTATGSYSFIGGGGDAGTAGNRNVASGDWSTVGGGTKNVASGAGSVIAGGGFEFDFNFGNTASGNSSVIGGGIINGATGSGSAVLAGWQNIANSTVSTVLGGRQGNTRGISGNMVFPACDIPIANTNGVTQAALLVLGRQTTDATPTKLSSDQSAATTYNQVILPNNSAYFFTGEVVAGVTGGGNTKGWTIEGVIKRGANAASTALVGTPTVTSSYADAGASTWVIAVTADTTNGGLAVTFTGQASTTIRTVAKISTVEMTY